MGGIEARDSPDGPRDMLALTVVFDHAVTDGAPVARFVQSLVELMTKVEALTGCNLSVPLSI